MTKITILNKAAAILEGHTRTILDIRTTIMVYREEEYCKKCPLSHNDKNQYTGVCDSKKGGCGCPTKQKTSQNQEPCPLGFWANDWFKPDKFEEYLKENNK